MMYDLSREERRHLAINRETTTGALIPKRCACGKAAKAKQLDQHGKCVACQLADRVATLHEGDLDILRHMLGATPHHAQVRWGFRNEYLVNRRDAAALERLVAAGFARAGRPLLQLQYFHATDVGCRLAGLSAKRAAVALSLGAKP
ncbi:hypothetical protein GTP55_25530 [Duganella sp. FT109W]|uniref:Uncharacterized protein n=1 Tax=Duganella margarita TaxID=2692170 RepID=A0ABW9WRH1_9BURK|nr:hypothetical protein [Duganella margarita]MYN42710.1 hypothetical protein [Duganella margarita]